MSERIANVHPKEYKGTTYKSTLEARTAETLDKLGIPIKYEERKITLIDGFRCQFQKNKVISVSYKPDFLVGNILIECKGFETPEWKIKRKLLFKYLMEHEPQTVYCEIHNAGKDLLQALDNHLTSLGLAVQTTPKPIGKKLSQSLRSTSLFDSVRQAMSELGLESKSITPVLKSLTGEREFVYGYNWKLVKLRL